MLTLSNLTKSYSGRTLFRDASLQVNRGERIGLVGPNGAGKSTLFSLILRRKFARRGPGDPRTRRDARLPAAGKRPGRRGERSSPSPPRTPRTNTPRTRSQPKAKRILHGSRLQGDRFREARAHVQRRLGHARAPRAAAHAGAGSADARRADEPPRPRSVALVPGLSERLSRRDPDDLARPGVPEPTHREHRRDQPRPAATLPGQLRQLPRPARRPPRTATRRLQGPAARDREPATVRRPFPRQGQPRQPGAEQAQADRAHGEARGARSRGGDGEVPFPAARAQRAEGDHAGKRRSGVPERPDDLQGAELRRRTRRAHRARRAERRGQIDPAQDAGGRACPIQGGRARASAAT